MKKLLISLFVLISCQIFAWEKVEILDEFKDPTGDIRIIQNNKNPEEDIVYIDAVYEKQNKTLKKDYLIAFVSWKNIKGVNNQTEIRIKVDNNKPLSLKGRMNSNQIVVSLIPNTLLQQMKTGKVMKVLIPKTTGEKTLSKYDLKDFPKYLELVK